MNLPKGVTGFWASGGQAPRAVDAKRFKSCCYEAARETSGKVAEFQAAYSGFVRNFHVAKLDWHDHQREVWCNAHHPLIAFVTSHDSRFIDDLRLGAFFADGFRLLSEHDLNQYPTPATLCDLDENELSQIRYWRPLRIGEIIFNSWD